MVVGVVVNVVLFDALLVALIVVRMCLHWRLKIVHGLWDLSWLWGAVVVLDVGIVVLFGALLVA